MGILPQASLVVPGLYFIVCKLGTVGISFVVPCISRFYYFSVDVDVAKIDIAHISSISIDINNMHGNGFGKEKMGGEFFRRGSVRLSFFRAVDAV